MKSQMFSWRHGLLLVLAGLLPPVLSAQGRAMAAPPTASASFILGTDADEATPTGKWYRRVYREAFQRMGVPLTVVVFPTARLTVVADQGDVHGQASRVFAYAEAHPNQLRVEESVHDVRLSLFAFAQAAQPSDPQRIEDLAAGKWLVEYRRGVAICENTLKPLLPAGRLTDVTSTEQGLKKLKAGRTDFFCDFDLAVLSELLTPELKGTSGYRPALSLDAGLSLYPYIHKSRAELAPRLAEALKKMKAEGLVERYFRDSKRELEGTR